MFDATDFISDQLIPPELNPLPLNTQAWLHLNSIDYNEEEDQIMLNSYMFNQVLIVDHSTTTEEAASGKGGRSGMGGRLLFRYGEGVEYEGQAIVVHGHNAHWVVNDYWKTASPVPRGIDRDVIMHINGDIESS